MGTKDGINSQSPIIPPFPVKNRQPQLSIKIDDADIEFFYREYYSMVYRRCLEILGNVEDAQDAVHDVFAKIQELKSVGKLHPDNPRSYLSTAARNMSINKINRAKRGLFLQIYDMATGGSLNWFRKIGEQGREVCEIGIMDNGYDLVEAKIIVDAILDEQDETTCKIYLYKYRDNETLENIGKIVGLSQPAVHKRIKKFEKQVRLKTGEAGK